MRIGIFGGAFDPVHLGHLITAEQAREQARLEQVWFLPTFQPPHKSRTLTPFHHRLEMLELAIAGHEAFRIDPLEKERTGPSYTVDTLRLLREKHPKHEFHLIVGGDCVPDLPHWRDPQGIAAQAPLVIIGRPDTAAIDPPSYFRWQRVETLLMQISSTDIRQRLTQGRSIRYLVPKAVECYLLQHQCYSMAG
jgi:nicotinate-nucleotide adenylyltransferase